MRAEWWALGVSILALVVSFIQSELWAWWKRPKLSTDLEDVHATEVILGQLSSGPVKAPCLFARILVSSSRGVANNVEVFADSLWMLVDGSFVLVTDFPRMNLKWSHTGAIKQDIGPIPKACDLGRLTGQYTPRVTDRLEEVARQRAGLPDNTQMFTLETEVAPNHARHVLSPGTYHLVLKIAAANAPLIPMTVGITFNGQWYESLDTVEAQGVLKVFPLSKMGL